MSSWMQVAEGALIALGWGVSLLSAALGLKSALIERSTAELKHKTATQRTQPIPPDQWLGRPEGSQ
jgi:hypothetical protein